VKKQYNNTWTNGISQLHVCPTRHTTTLNEVEETRVETDYKSLTMIKSN